MARWRNLAREGRVDATRDCSTWRTNMRSSSWMLAAAAAVAIVSFAPRADAAMAARDDAVSAASRHHHLRHHWQPRTTTGFSGSRVWAPNNAKPTGSQAYDAQQGLGGKFGG